MATLSLSHCTSCRQRFANSLGKISMTSMPRPLSAAVSFCKVILSPRFLRLRTSPQERSDSSVSPPSPPSSLPPRGRPRRRAPPSERHRRRPSAPQGARSGRGAAGRRSHRWRGRGRWASGADRLRGNQRHNRD